MQYRALSQHSSSKKTSTSALFQVIFSLILIITIGLTTPLSAQETIAESEAYAVLEATEKSIIDTQEKINEAKKELTSADSEESAAAIKERIEQLQSRLNQARNEFEKYALGGIDLHYIKEKENITDLNYDWQAELLQIVQPVFAEIQRLTQNSRERDTLTRDLSLYNEKIEQLEKGLEFLQKAPFEQLTPESQKRLEVIQSNWETFLTDLLRERDRTQTLLDAMVTDKSFMESLKDGLLDFIKGRGLILVVSFSTFILVLYLFTKGMDLLIARRAKKEQGMIQRVNLKGRLLLLAYRVFSVVVSVIAYLIVLHAMGDMVLFGIAILILLALIFAFRNYVPKYFSEIRLFLNLGSARQGERVIYRGIPWRIERITLYSATLVNPAIDNGRIRLMLPELATLTSRPLQSDEIWFPAKVGDSFILPNGVFGEVKRITPESVYLNSFNSTIIYPAPDFIAGAPTNLSYGYYAVADFGLSYKHFATPVDEIFTKLKAYIEEFLSHTGMHDQYNSISVEFRRINEGISLVYTVIVAMKGSGAGYYFQSGRLLQEACLRCAQKEGWSMPFTNIEMRDNNHRVIDVTPHSATLS
ncbi:hypothetical protein HX037_01360 [Ignatzschineria indica]|uniref:hypothetical protein n=1 Tax=Ignatzschineria indica TaxID=472583 RepID=UPI0025792415|nr:hypothetical protein [Ignatzschineria indica]MDM1544536.1 hypothetical protein [Ignatzschineria indica]